MSHKLLLTVLSLFLGLCLCQGSYASYAVPDENIGTGVVQSVNYVNHTVTVAGHAYRISSKAVYIGVGVEDLQGLQTGTNIRFIANGPAKKPESSIINIVVLPPATP